jgi:proline racemase
VVDCHAEGEVGRVVVGGVLQIPGDTVFDKRLFLQIYQDDLRRMILFEPRGAVHHNANVLVPSTNPEAQMGYVILESTEYPAMSGSNTMCVATVLLETGILPMSEPTTELTFESPAGLIRGRATALTARSIGFASSTNRPSATTWTRRSTCRASESSSSTSSTEA